MSSAPPHPFEALTKLEDEFHCPVCLELMLPCYSFGCHQICGSCADSLPNKRKCPTCNKVWKDPPASNKMISGLVEKAVAGQVFRCCKCQEILTGRVERDAHATTCAAATNESQQQQQQQQQQEKTQQQLAPPPPRRPTPPSASAPAPATELPPAPSKPASGAAAPPAAAAAAAAPAGGGGASSSSVQTKQCSDCTELLPRGSFSNSQWTRKDGAFRCTNCVKKEQQAFEQRRRVKQEVQRRRKEEEQQRREQEERMRREQAEQRAAEQQRRREEEEERRSEQEKKRRRDQQRVAQLIDAAFDGDIDAIRSLVARDDFAKIRDLRGKHGWAALHAASQEGHDDCAQALLDGGCDIAVVGNGLTALHLAATHDNVAIIRTLAAHSDWAKVRDVRSTIDGSTALFLAAERGRAGCVQALLAGGCDIGIGTTNCLTPLHGAAQQGKVDVLRLLIAHADFAKVRGKRSNNNNTALHLAVFSKKTACVQALLTAGCDATLVEKNGLTPFHMAASIGDEGMLRMFIDAPGFEQVRDFRATSQSGDPALSVAAYRGHTECVRAMVAAGCDITVVNSIGQTALHLAASQGKADCMRVLVTAPGFEKIRDRRSVYGETALHWASQLGHADCVRALVEGGCDVSVRDTRDGRTAIDLARTAEIKKILRS